ncbi:hypothetical protein [Helicobacter mehlei]|uniref:Uncharacterized protein n=1 Tax=Helicobacter mehlei TaxID=2316080 RepID=A0A553V3L8_9HELI|nr:hypothetical protein [Helicobacter mehlei]TSA87032.1 hypothetical protein FNE76_00785 [Helicobacter mehlei]
MESAQTRDDASFTGKSVSEQPKADDVLLPNQDDFSTTPQTSPLSIPELKNQAKWIYTKAQEQEAGFKQLLEGLKGGLKHHRN